MFKKVSKCTFYVSLLSLLVFGVANLTNAQFGLDELDVLDDLDTSVVDISESTSIETTGVEIDEEGNIELEGLGTVGADGSVDLRYGDDTIKVDADGGVDLKYGDDAIKVDAGGSVNVSGIDGSIKVSPDGFIDLDYAGIKVKSDAKGVFVESDAVRVRVNDSEVTVSDSEELGVSITEAWMNIKVNGEVLIDGDGLKVQNVLGKSFSMNILSSELDSILEDEMDFIGGNIELTTTENNALYKITGRENRRLFGFVPVSVAKIAYVNIETGSIYDISSSWWSFLTTDDKKSSS